MNFSRLLFRSCSVLTLGVAAVSSWAQPAEMDETAHAQALEQRAQLRDQGRAEIAAARRAIETRLQENEKACWQRFAVQNCLDKARKAAREQDQPLRERELSINQEERQEKAAERLRAIEQKQREKQVPAPVVATPRDGSGPLSVETRHSEAQKRAAQQAQRVQNHEAAVAAQQAQQAQARAQKVQEQKDKQAAAQARRESKAKEIGSSQAAPLPIPDIPKP